MSIEWPQFLTPNQIGGSRAWTARFDSYDQRNEDCYYAITILDGGVPTARFITRIDLSWVGDDWTSPGFAGRLRDELHEAALSGRSNTDYPGRR